MLGAVTDVRLRNELPRRRQDRTDQFTAVRESQEVLPELCAVHFLSIFYFRENRDKLATFIVPVFKRQKLTCIILSVSV